MPSKSLAQNRFVHAAANRGEAWAIEWIRKQHGHTIPRVEHASMAKQLVRGRKRRKRIPPRHPMSA